MTHYKYMDDMDVRNQMRADKRKGPKKNLSKYRKPVKNMNRMRADKRKGGGCTSNKHRKRVVRFVKKEKNVPVV